MRDLNFEEVQEVNGGDWDWGAIGTGVALIGLGVAIVATAGLATVPIGLAGAATAGEIIVAGAALGAAGAGGVAIGSGMQEE
ncbi:hypothetical protein M0D21_22830 [Aquimarina sp. D1M17]|uniref:hypothetical protein n=1 Tax=Aquimarina acroporae TaxID=2937283 RepID=UPI0020BFE417|nr:hypothetical protein [Aquimarina acroporae]MCK8524426.1 hypothetical protein [Aquimarina acroporae]